MTYTKNRMPYGEMSLTTNDSNQRNDLYENEYNRKNKISPENS